MVMRMVLRMVMVGNDYLVLWLDRDIAWPPNVGINYLYIY